MPNTVFTWSLSILSSLWCCGFLQCSVWTLSTPMFKVGKPGHVPVDIATDVSLTRAYTVTPLAFGFLFSSQGTPQQHPSENCKNTGFISHACWRAHGMPKGHLRKSQKWREPWQRERENTAEGSGLWGVHGWRGWGFWAHLLLVFKTWVELDDGKTGEGRWEQSYGMSKSWELKA